jgi:hypothetical protein
MLPPVQATYDPCQGKRKGGVIVGLVYKLYNTGYTLCIQYIRQDRTQIFLTNSSSHKVNPMAYKEAAETSAKRSEEAAVPLACRGTQ